MERHSSIQSRYSALVAEVNTIHELGLSKSEQQRYVAALLRYRLPGENDETDEILRRQILFYHKEYKRIEILKNRNHPNYEAEWKEVSDYIIRIIHSKQLVWESQRLNTAEDIQQNVLEALPGSLVSYRYDARFTTWLHGFITNIAHKTNRLQRAGKRDGKPSSLDEHPGLDQPASEHEHPETYVNVRELARLVHAALEHDQRLEKIFWLSVDGLKLAEIGKHVQLSTTQVHTLLHKARTLVQQQPGLREGWPERCKPQEQPPALPQAD
jgi:RNA polymerase sigma factor (sigma-70 family)